MPVAILSSRVSDLLRRSDMSALGTAVQWSVSVGNGRSRNVRCASVSCHLRGRKLKPLADAVV